jgi:hypothetical protein
LNIATNCFPYSNPIHAAFLKQTVLEVGCGTMFVSVIVLNIVIHWKAREIARENTLEGEGECKRELYIIISDSLNTNEQLFTHAYHRQNDH